jgi:large repetitive protein
VTGIFSSTDKGATWTRVNDDAHQYGGPGNGQFVQGDMNTYGRVYMSTAGRGIAYGSTIQEPFTLPSNNFTVLITDLTCSGNNDGKISITAVQDLNYQAVLTVNGTATSYPFTTTLDISTLNAGTYPLCIYVVGQSGFQQCYSLTLTGPKPLSVYTTSVTGSRNIVVNLSGASLYQVQLNDKTFTTTADTITLPLANGLNTLTVSTDKACQGAYTKNIFVDGNKNAYPNPFASTMNIDMGTDPSKSAFIRVYAINGIMVYSKAVMVNSGTIPLDLSTLKRGTYLINIKTDAGESSIKIEKK